MSRSDWLTPQEVGNLIGGFSAQFVRNEIRSGELAALYVRSRNGKMGYYRIRLVDAQAYEAHLVSRSLAPTKPASVTGPTLTPQPCGYVAVYENGLISVPLLCSLSSGHCGEHEFWQVKGRAPNDRAAITQTTQTTKTSR